MPFREEHYIKLADLGDACPSEPVPPSPTLPNGEQAARWFGLNAAGVDATGAGIGKFGAFVGVRRLPGATTPLHVVPKFERMDYAAMYAECAADPVVSRRLEQTFYIWPDERSVDLKLAAHPWFTSLLIHAYLRALSALCARHLRRNFLRRVKNLQGRVKGRVHIGEQIRRNLAHLRPDRTICEFIVLDDDTIENRILRAALEVGATRLARDGQLGKLALRWIGASRAALSGVSVERINQRDFASARSAGAFRHYREPFRLARAVLQHLGLDPHGADRAKPHLAVPPFALCTYELFERYVEARLRRDPSLFLWVGYADKNLGDGVFKVRPDFVGSDNAIYDAKYKRFDNWDASAMREDIYKSVAYSRHLGVCDKLVEIGCPDRATGKVVLLYPRLNRSDWVSPQTDNSFDIAVEVRAIDCPSVAAQATNVPNAS